MKIEFERAEEERKTHLTYLLLGLHSLQVLRNCLLRLWVGIQQEWKERGLEAEICVTLSRWKLGRQEAMAGGLLQTWL